YRGCYRRDAGADLRYLSRVRPLHRRRRQRDHEERRQYLFGQRPDQFHQSVVDHGDPVRGGEKPGERGSSRHPQETYEGTFGGPVVRDRLWFFVSGRYGSVDSTTTLQQTGITLPTNDLNKRGEVKVTGTVAPNHTIQGGYLTDPRTRTNNSGLQSFVISPDSEVTRKNPNWYYYTNYHGIQGN